MQLSIFDLEETEFEIYEALLENGLSYKIADYKMYQNRDDVLKYYYIKTECGKLIDLLISSYDDKSTIFEIYKNLHHIFLDDWFKRR